MPNYEIVKINYESTSLLSQFLAQLGNGERKFRYFRKRPLSIIKNHLVTMLLLTNEKPIAYGHLDKEEDKVWLGIAVAKGYKGQGLGNIMMKNLMSEAVRLNCKEINLTVDIDNNAAISLYRKFGFTDKNRTDKYLHLSHTKN